MNWLIQFHYQAHWDQSNMIQGGITKVVKMINEQGQEIETIAPDLETALSKMAERTLYVQEHQRRTQEILGIWSDICSLNGSHWTGLIERIDETLAWLVQNRKQFPNFPAHLEQWKERRALAERRSYIIDIPQKCPGDPLKCTETGNCFNLEHMYGQYVFERSEPKDGLCIVTLRDRRA